MLPYPWEGVFFCLWWPMDKSWWYITSHGMPMELRGTCSAPKRWIVSVLAILAHSTSINQKTTWWSFSTRYNALNSRFRPKLFPCASWSAKNCCYIVIKPMYKQKSTALRMHETNSGYSGSHLWSSRQGFPTNDLPSWTGALECSRCSWCKSPSSPFQNHMSNTPFQITLSFRSISSIHQK